MLLEGYEFKSPKKEKQEEAEEREQQEPELSEEEDVVADDATDDLSALGAKIRQSNEAAAADRIEEVKEPAARQEKFQVVGQDGAVVHMKRKKKRPAHLSKQQQHQADSRPNASPESKPQPPRYPDYDDELEQLNERLSRAKITSSEKKPAF